MTGKYVKFILVWYELIYRIAGCFIEKLILENIISYESQLLQARQMMKD
jgi:hypothetical protein